MKMTNWKKNLLAAGVLLVVCAGIYMNWMYANSDAVGNLTDVLDTKKVMSENGIVLDVNAQPDDELPGGNTMTDYFAAVRLSRQEARDSAVSVLQEAIAMGPGSDVQGSSTKLDEIVQTALCEAQIESLIIAKGYSDCVAYMSDEGISVAVASPEGGIQQADVAVIADVVITQTGLSMADIHVVEVK